MRFPGGPLRWRPSRDGAACLARQLPSALRAPGSLVHAPGCTCWCSFLSLQPRPLTRAHQDFHAVMVFGNVWVEVPELVVSWPLLLPRRTSHVRHKHGPRALQCSSWTGQAGDPRYRWRRQRLPAAAAASQEGWEWQRRMRAGRGSSGAGGNIAIDGGSACQGHWQRGRTRGGSREVPP